MSTPQQETARGTLIASLYVQALRQGQASWFRVVSASMNPLLHISDAIHIEPAYAQEIQIGEIAAFETARGLVIHRIVQRQQTGTGTRLLQMADNEIRPTWIDEQAVVGRVTTIRRGTRDINLQSPLARTCGATIATVRYQLYVKKRTKLPRTLLRICSRVAIQIACCCVNRS